MDAIFCISNFISILGFSAVPPVASCSANLSLICSSRSLRLTGSESWIRGMSMVRRVDSIGAGGGESRGREVGGGAGSTMGEMDLWKGREI